MNPSTIAIIPLVLAVASCWAAFYKSSRDDNFGKAHSAMFGIICVTLAALGLSFLAYLAGVVVFNDWEYLA